MRPAWELGLMEVRLAAETAALHSASECWSAEQLSQLLVRILP